MELYETLPIVPLRDVVVFPHMMMPFVIGRPSSTRALEHALGKGPLLRTFREVLGRTELLAKVEGMREGLELYEYGLRIQNKNPLAFTRGFSNCC